MAIMLSAEKNAVACPTSMIAILIVLSSAAVYAGAGFVVAPSKTAALGTLPPATYSAGASINSTAVQIASAIGSSLFVGVLSADVLRDTAAGRGEGVGVRRGVRAHPLDSRRHRGGGAARRVLLRPRHAQTGR